MHPPSTVQGLIDAKLTQFYSRLCDTQVCFIYWLLTIILHCIIIAISDYKQSLQFRHLNEEKQNIHIEVLFLANKLLFIVKKCQQYFLGENNNIINKII